MLNPAKLLARKSSDNKLTSLLSKLDHQINLAVRASSTNSLAHVMSSNNLVGYLVRWVASKMLILHRFKPNMPIDMANLSIHTLAL